jgi:hypothetical protein
VLQPHQQAQQRAVAARGAQLVHSLGAVSERQRGGSAVAREP